MINVIIQEFLIAIDMALNGSPEEKLRWGFRIFDKDGSGEEWGPSEIQGSRQHKQFSPSLASGSIELKEMTKIMTCLLELEGIGKVGKSWTEEESVSTVYRGQPKRMPLISSITWM